MIGKLIFWWQKKLKQRYLEKNRSRLLVDDFTIISSNCWGGILYSDLGLRYHSPFVNMFIYAPCFVKMLSNLDAYLAKELSIVDQSKYFTTKPSYPLGMLGDVEIHFIHDQDSSEVHSKWVDRLSRINRDKMMFVMCERDLCTEKEIRAFDQLPLKNKICFTVGSYAFPSVQRIGELALLKEVPPADQAAGFTYVKSGIIDYINHAFS